MVASVHDEAERLVRRRARLWPVLAAVFVAQQASYFVTQPPAHLVRTVDWVKFGGWAMLTLVLILLLWTGGFWFKRREVRALMDDEGTRAHRADALALGFLLAMLATVALYLLAMVEPVEPRMAFHIIASAGIATALVRFGFLERRADQLG